MRAWISAWDTVKMTSLSRSQDPIGKWVRLGPVSSNVSKSSLEFSGSERKEGGPDSLTSLDRRPCLLSRWSGWRTGAWSQTEASQSYWSTRSSHYSPSGPAPQLCSGLRNILFILGGNKLFYCWRDKIFYLYRRKIFCGYRIFYIYLQWEQRIDILMVETGDT